MKRWKRALLMPWAGAGNNLAYTNKVIALAPIAYWPLADASGTTATDESGNGRNGAYSNVTLGATGIGDGRTAATFLAASTSRVNVYSTSFRDAFNNAEGTIAIWLAVTSAAVWSDGASRRIFSLRVDGSNEVNIQKLTTSNQIIFGYVAGATSKTVTATVGPTTAYVHLALTWSKAANQMKAYVNGAQSGSTQTGLGTWAGTLNINTTGIGARSTNIADQNMSGDMAHAAVWTTPLSATQILSLATVP